MNSLLWMIAIAMIAAVAACAPAAAPANGNAVSATDAVALKSTTALSLAELAYNSGEAAATAAVRSGALTPAEDQAIGNAVGQARSDRDAARDLVAEGGDASAAIESLDQALDQIQIIAHPAQQ